MRRYSTPRLSPAMIVAVIAVVLAIGGTSYAALSKNSVGTKQLKKNAVTAQKIKKNAVVTAKIKKDAVTGAKVKESTLGTVPSATASTTASVANSLSPIEATHLVGTAGQPSFESGSNNAPSEVPGVTFQPVGFYKDHQGMVHLDGVALAGEASPLGIIFTLPPGFRPASGKIQAFGSAGGGAVLVVGANVVLEGTDLSGKVVGEKGELVPLSGVSYKAEG